MNLKTPFYSLQLNYSNEIQSEIIECEINSIHQTILEKTKITKGYYYQLIKEYDTKRSINITNEYKKRLKKDNAFTRNRKEKFRLVKGRRGGVKDITFIADRAKDNK